jgi:RES domain-containing protein
MLSKVLNLTDETILAELGISQADLKETDWPGIQRSGGVALTQLIGRYARSAGFEALLVPSAKFPGKNLDIFYPDNLLPTSEVALINADRLPDEASNH